MHSSCYWVAFPSTCGLTPPPLPTFKEHITKNNLKTLTHMSEIPTQKPHQFWGTQPVPQSYEEVVIAGPMDAAKTLDDVQQEPLPIASTFEWWSPNLESRKDLIAIYELLRDNYVEDDDSMFRFNYSVEFLKWALTPPGFIPDWHVAVRRKSDGKLLAFISGIPMTMKMGTPAALQEIATKQLANEGKPIELYTEPRRICEINFLCVHKQLREKRLAPILIKEVTRRVNTHNIWQAVYTAGAVLPTPFASGKYFHRSLNPEKLVAIRFSRIKPQFRRFQNPMAMMKRAYQLPSVTKTKDLREMTEGDVPQVTELLNTYISRYDVYPVFTEEEVNHYLVPREGVVYTFVVGDAGHVTDFFSFYSLPSTIIGNSEYSELRAAYVHYYACLTVPLVQLMNDMLIMANNMGFDVCNVVNILQNGEYLDELKFGSGDGKLNYYFYNWAYPRLEPSQVALVML